MKDIGHRNTLENFTAGIRIKFESGILISQILIQSLGVFHPSDISIRCNIKGEVELLPSNLITLVYIAAEEDENC